MGDPLQVGFPDNGFDTVNGVIPSGPIGHVVVGYSNGTGSDVYTTTGSSGFITAGALNGAGTHVNLSSQFQFTTDPQTKRAYLVGGARVMSAISPVASCVVLAAPPSRPPSTATLRLSQ